MNLINFKWKSGDLRLDIYEIVNVANLILNSIKIHIIKSSLTNNLFNSTLKMRSSFKIIL